VKVVSARLEGLDAKALRDALDMVKERFPDAVVLLAPREGKASLVAGVKGSALGKVKAGELLVARRHQIGGKGGGRPDMAQGGGPTARAGRGAGRRARLGGASWLRRASRRTAARRPKVSPSALLVCA
jgi:alanyl-tRNA synthetase